MPKLPDALRLSGLRGLCNILNMRGFVGRIRRLHRIRQVQYALCQQPELQSWKGDIAWIADRFPDQREPFFLMLL